MQLRPTLIAILSIFAGDCFAADDHADDMAESLALFKSEVRSILVENCVKCHGGEKVRSDYDLTTRTGLLTGGDIGVSVIAGNSKQSPIFDYLGHREEPTMPPKKPPLPEQSIAAIAKWIDLGAAYDQPLVDQANRSTGPMQVSDAERDYWAFAPLQQEFPKGASIDYFIRVSQQERGLTQAPPAPRGTLIRRAYFDLTGLPPEPEAIESFLADDSPRPTSHSSMHSSPARDLASAGRATGSMSHASQRATGSSTTTTASSPSTTVTLSSARSTGTCPTTSLSAGRSRATRSHRRIRSR